MNNNTQIPQNNNNYERYYQQKFLEHAAFTEHYARLKMANAGNDQEYYKYAELEYFNKSRALHYKGLFSAASTINESLS